jgi:hypothetical protein
MLCRTRCWLAATTPTEAWLVVVSVQGLCVGCSSFFCVWFGVVMVLWAAFGPCAYFPSLLLVVLAFCALVTAGRERSAAASAMCSDVA